MLTEAEIQTLRNNPDALNAIQLQLADYGSPINVAQAFNNPNSPLYKALMSDLDKLFALDAIKQQNQQMQAQYNQLLILSPAVRSIPIHDDQHLPTSDENKTKSQQKIANDDSLFKQLMDKLKTVQDQMNNVQQQLEAAVKEHIQTTGKIAAAETELNAVAVVFNQNNKVSHKEYLVNLQILQSNNPSLINRDEVEKLQKNPDFIATFQTQNAHQLQLIVQDIKTRQDQLIANQKQLETKLDRLMLEHKDLSETQNRLLKDINNLLAQNGARFNQTPSPKPCGKNSEKEEAKRLELFEWIKKCLLKREEKQAAEAKQNDASRPTPRPTAKR